MGKAAQSYWELNYISETEESKTIFETVIILFFSCDCQAEKMDFLRHYFLLFCFLFQNRFFHSEKQQERTSEYKVWSTETEPQLSACCPYIAL